MPARNVLGGPLIEEVTEMPTRNPRSMRQSQEEQSRHVLVIGSNRTMKTLLPTNLSHLQNRQMKPRPRALARSCLIPYRSVKQMQGREELYVDLVHVTSMALKLRFLPSNDENQIEMPQACTKSLRRRPQASALKVKTRQQPKQQQHRLLGRTLNTKFYRK